jgi:hypothetical protein
MWGLFSCLVLWNLSLEKLLPFCELYWSSFLLSVACFLFNSIFSRRNSQDWIQNSDSGSKHSSRSESPNEHWLVEEAERRRKSGRTSNFQSGPIKPKSDIISNRWQEDRYSQTWWSFVSCDCSFSGRLLKGFADLFINNISSLDRFSRWGISSLGGLHDDDVSNDLGLKFESALKKWGLFSCLVLWIHLNQKSVIHKTGYKIVIVVASILLDLKVLTNTG